MTSNAAFKKQVRKIASDLGLPYTEARTRVLKINQEPIYIGRNKIVHPDPSIQPPTYLTVEGDGSVSLDRIDAHYGDKLPQYTDEVCRALSRLKLVAAVRRRPNSTSIWGGDVEPQTLYLSIDARTKADRATLQRVLYQAWLGNARPAYELADRWRFEIKPGNGWHWNIARAFGEEVSDPPRPKRGPRQRRQNLDGESQETYGDLSAWPRDKDGNLVLLVEAQGASKSVSLLTGPCPLCGSQHSHGGPCGLAPGDSDGTRVPHCTTRAFRELNEQYVLVVAEPGQIVWPDKCQALTHKGMPCRNPTARRSDNRNDVLCKTHRDDFEHRTESQEPVRWAR